MSKTLYLIRHGEVEGNQRQAFVGHRDLSLNPQGVEELQALKSQLKIQAHASLYSSPALRARESSEILFPHQSIETSTDFMEINFGDWEGKTYAELQKSDPSGIKDWEEQGDAFQFPNGEALSAFHARIKNGARTLSLCKENECILVSHGGVIRSLICHYLDLPMDKHYCFQVSTASLSVIELYGEKGILKALNQTIKDH